MRYGSHFEPEAFAFEGYESSFEIFEGPDHEATVGGIPERDYLRWVQFSLNMYFKKTALRGPVAEDGKDSTEFRDALEFFNANATGRKRYRDIDKRTQDALIIANEQNAGYLAWLRTQLDRLGLTALTTRYAANEKPTMAITTFQGIYNGVFGFSLVQDEFVGAKTHLAILHAIDALEPKPPERCTICDIIRIAPVDDLAANEAEHSRLRCLREFFADALNGKEFDDRYWTYPFETYLGQVVPCSFVGQKNSQGISFKDKKTKRAVQGFKDRIAGTTDKTKIARAIKAIHDDIFCQINSLSRAIQEALGDVSSRWETRECVEARMLQSQSVKRRPESIFKCFRSLLSKSFSKTCRIPE